MIRLGDYDILSGDIQVIEGELGSLLSIPECQEPDTNDWGDEDGLEVDLSEGMNLKPHTINLRLYCAIQGQSFVNALMRSHSSRLEIFGRVFDLRPTGFTLHDELAVIQEVELKAVVQEHTPDITLPSSYNPLSRFALLEGSEVGLHQYREVKEGHSNGYYYVGGNRVVRKSREIELSLFYSCSSWSELWAERDMLRAWLTDNGLRVLSYDEDVLRGYYKKLDTKELIVQGGRIIWVSTLYFVVSE